MVCPGRDSPAVPAFCRGTRSSVLKLLSGLKKTGKPGDHVAEPTSLIVAPPLFHEFTGRAGARELRFDLRTEQQTGETTRTHQRVPHGRNVVLLPVVLHEHGLADQFP